MARPTANPVLVEVFRGDRVESCHRGAVAIAEARGRLVLALGDVETPVYPRSAVKALQALPLVESGAADAFELTDAELAVACASHSGDRVHLEAVANLLAKANLRERDLACGAHWPISEATSRELLRAGRRPRAIHNNCSGKHAGMLAAAVHLGFDPQGYETPEHPLQAAITRILSETCGVALEPDDMGIDGCSLPTYAMPLRALARGFARFGTGARLPPDYAPAAKKLMEACFAAPVLVAGEGRLDTKVLRGLPAAAFTKGGAEGVHVAALPALGLGVALKVDDGAKRGAERVLVEILAALLPKARTALSDELDGTLHNWRGRRVGRLAASEALSGALGDFAEQRS
jgi:L-asparaginase II